MNTRNQSSWTSLHTVPAFKAPKHFRDTDKNDASYETDLAAYYKQPEKLDVALQEREELNELAFEPLYVRFFQERIRSLQEQANRYRKGKNKSKHKGEDEDKVKKKGHYKEKTLPRRLAKRDAHENSRQRCFVAKTRFIQNLRRIVLEDIEYDLSQPPVETKRNSLEDLKRIYDEDLFTKGWCREQVNIDRTLKLEEHYEGYILSGLQRFADEHGRLPEGCDTCAWATDDLYLDVQLIARRTRRGKFPTIFHNYDDDFDDYGGYDSEEVEPRSSAFESNSSFEYEDEPMTKKEIEEEKKILLAFETRYDHLEQEFDCGAKRVRA